MVDSSLVDSLSLGVSGVDYSSLVGSLSMLVSGKIAHFCGKFYQWLHHG